jgi:hypothetical protein
MLPTPRILVNETLPKSACQTGTVNGFIDKIERERPGATGKQ